MPFTLNPQVQVLEAELDRAQHNLVSLEDSRRRNVTCAYNKGFGAGWQCAAETMVPPPSHYDADEHQAHDLCWAVEDSCRLARWPSELSLHDTGPSRSQTQGATPPCCPPTPTDGVTACPSAEGTSLGDATQIGHPHPHGARASHLARPSPPPGRPPTLGVPSRPPGSSPGRKSTPCLGANQVNPRTSGRHHII